MPLSKRAAGQSRVDRRQQRGAPEKVANQKPEGEDEQGDQKARHEAEELLNEALKGSELQGVDGRDDETDPDDPEDNLRNQQFGARHVRDAEHFARPARNARRSNRKPTSNRWTPRRATMAMTKPPPKMIAAATSLGTNSTKAVAKLRQDRTSSSAIS